MPSSHPPSRESPDDGLPDASSNPSLSAPSSPSPSTMREQPTGAVVTAKSRASVLSSVRSSDGAEGSGRIVGRGEMADRVRSFDWKSTPLGPVESWSKELLTIVNLTLCSKWPARAMWGPEFVLIYNDAYRWIPGPRHPAALGQSAKEVYHESWGVVGPLLEAAYTTGETLFHEKLLVPLPTENGIRHVYLNYAFNPVFEGGRIAGLFGPVYDVTEEVLATRQLKESEARASRILRSIGDAVIVTDAEACITRMNVVAENLTGWRIEEAKGRSLPEIFRIVNEDTREMVESPAEKVKRLGTVVGLANHTILIAKDGTETHIDDSGAPIRNEAGEMTGIVLVFRDINERRAAERERDALTARLDEVLETTTDAVLSIGRDWCVMYMNAAAKGIAAPIENIVGGNFWQCFPAAVYEGSPFVENYYRAMDYGVSAEFEAYYPAPLNIWVQVSVRPSTEGIVLFFRDVTEEKRAALVLQETMDALKASEEELRWTLDLSTQLTWTANVEGQLLDTGDSWMKLTGLTKEQSLGLGWGKALPPDEMLMMAERWQHSVVTGEPLDVEHRLMTASGEYRWMHSSALPRKDASGKIVKWYGTTEDIEDRKRSVRALLQSEKLAAVGRLASSIAHEINNPLESVMNLIYLAREHAVDPEAQQYLDMADQEVRRISVIANQTLRFHKQPSNPQAANCGDLYASVLSIYEGKLRNSGVEVDMRFRAAEPVVCFEGDIRQVLSNLVGNAIDAMPKGGLLRLRSRRGVDWRTGRRGVVMTVADSGNGMSAETLRHIFDPFFTTKGISGTGLGLWVSQEIVGRHGGELYARSRQGDGSGTVFALFLPFGG